MRRFNIPLDSPTINFNDKELLRKACYQYLKQFGIKKNVFAPAFEKGYQEHTNYKEQIKLKGDEIIKKALTKNPLGRSNGKILVVLAGRPYQTDPLINHKTPEILADLGVDVITDDCVPSQHKGKMSDLHILTQWAYPNRL